MCGLEWEGAGQAVWAGLLCGLDWKGYVVWAGLVGAGREGEGEPHMHTTHNCIGWAGRGGPYKLG